MTVAWGLLGLGHMAARLAPALAAAGNARLQAVASRDPRKAEEFARGHGAPAWYGSYEELAADPAVDAVYVATPTAFHAEQTILCLEAGKHVLVEKPMAMSVEEAARMVAAARERGLVLGVGFHLRHHPVHRELARLLRAGEAGEPILAHGIWGSYVPDFPRDSWAMDAKLAGAGSMIGVGVHVLDLLCWFVGRAPVEVAALDDGANPAWPVEFLTTASIRFEDDVLAQLVASRRLPNAANSVAVYGAEARLEARSTLSMDPQGELAVTRGGETATTTLPLGDLYALEVEAFSGAVEEGGEFHASGEDGLLTVALTEAIAESATTGRAVRPELHARL
jgi:1,5-anhydro-D-fructose reductase (1,5-anhydro-D-mannitol-forming)